MKTYQTSIKQSAQQRGGKRYKLKGPKSWQTKDPPQKEDCYRNKNKSNTQNPSHDKHAKYTEGKNT